MKDEENVESIKADEPVEEQPAEEVEEPRKAKAGTPAPPYGPNIPRRWQNTPFNDLPENLQAAARES